MAQDTTQELVEKEVKEIRTKAEVNEAYFVGLCWSDPFNHYTEYSDTISQDEFIHEVWGFYFELGRRLYQDENIKKFDDISVMKSVKDFNIEDEFNKYGGLTTIEDAVEIVKYNSENIEHYYESIKRNYTIRQLYALFGDKVFLKKGRYNWKEMPRELLASYWTDKANKIGLDNINRYEAENLYIDPQEYIRKLIEESADMLPYYNSRLLQSISQGTPRGHVTMIGGFGGTGKSSITSEKFVMSCVVNNEKAIVILNEEDAQAFREKIVLSILWHEFHTGLDRKKLKNGKLSDVDKDKITKAFNRMHELTEGNEALIKIIFMEKYVMKDLEKIVRFWANRGYTNLLIDTHKVSDNSQYEKRWETFVEDMKVIYRLTRKNAGGMNLRTVVTFQLADSAIRNKYLDFEAIGEGKASKNEASIMYMFRPVWSSEYYSDSAKAKPLKCWRNVKGEDGEYRREEFYLEWGKTYYLWFTPKNRFGQTNDNGQAVLVIEPSFNNNHFKEIGWCFVANDKGNR
ncbi:ATPase domain-containing protein [Halobacillus rhizosphaerae]|uniref:ATPase domain-containing protein n=1 Tax=Halobacillus rhizosphaerae TaxID=3064889 RepID=UPI00398AE2C1